MERVKREIEKRLNECDFWELEILCRLCEMADMSEEFEKADGENFESVIYAAAEKIGIDI